MLKKRNTALSCRGVDPGLLGQVGRCPASFLPNQTCTASEPVVPTADLPSREVSELSFAQNGRTGATPRSPGPVRWCAGPASEWHTERGSARGGRDARVCATTHEDGYLAPPVLPEAFFFPFSKAYMGTHIITTCYFFSIHYL